MVFYIARRLAIFKAFKIYGAGYRRSRLTNSIYTIALKMVEEFKCISSLFLMNS